MSAAGVIQFAFMGVLHRPIGCPPGPGSTRRGKALIEPHGGVIVAELFDVDKSRSIPPQRRPEAARLLAALADPGRGFDAVVVGEPSGRSTATSSATRSRCSSTSECRCGCPRSGGPIDPAPRFGYHGEQDRRQGRGLPLQPRAAWPPLQDGERMAQDQDLRGPPRLLALGHA